MEQTEAAQIVSRLNIELSEAREAVSAAQRRVDALEKVVAGLLDLFPGLASDSETDAPEDTLDKPRGQEALLRVMGSVGFKGRYWTLPTMMTELEKRGWVPDSKNDPGNAVRVSLDRLAASDSRVRKGRGSTGTVVWYWQGEGYPEPHFAGELVAPEHLHAVRYRDTRTEEDDTA